MKRVKNSKVKICHVVYRFSTGGLENGLVNLINCLPSENFEHVIVTLQGHSPEFFGRLNKSVAIFDLNKQPGKDVAVFWRAWKLFRKLNPDILHTRNLAALEMQVIGFFAGIPYRIHGEHGWDINDPNGTVIRYQKLRKFVGHFIHRFIALSKEQEQYLLDKVRISEAKVQRICNGVDTEKFSDQLFATNKLHRTESGASNGKIVIGCVGRLAPIKGHSVLLKAFKKVSDACDQQVCLKIAGDGEERESLEVCARDLNITDRITFMGNQANIPEVMAGFDFFVLPSLAEGISNTILEAMAAGLPVIATDVGGNADLVTDNETGLIVPSNSPDDLANAMIRLIKEPETCKDFSVKGRSKACSEFSLSTMVARYHQLYQN